MKNALHAILLPFIFLRTNFVEQIRFEKVFSPKCHWISNLNVKGKVFLREYRRVHNCTKSHLHTVSRSVHPPLSNLAGTWVEGVACVHQWSSYRTIYWSFQEPVLQTFKNRFLGFLGPILMLHLSVWALETLYFWKHQVCLCSGIWWLWKTMFSRCLFLISSLLQLICTIFSQSVISNSIGYWQQKSLLVQRSCLIALTISSALHPLLICWHCWCKLTMWM